MSDLEVLSTDGGEYFRWDPFGGARGMDLEAEGYVRLEEATTDQLAAAVPALLRRVDRLERKLDELQPPHKGGG